MQHVAIAQPYIPSYSLPFFEGLVSKLATDGIVLTVLHSPGLGQARSRRDVELPAWSVPVRAREVQIAGRILVARWLPSQARRADLLILEQAIGKTDALQLLRPFRRRPIALMGHGHIHNRSTMPAEEALMRGLTARADWFFAYTCSARDDAQAAGLPEDRITVFENSTDTAALASERRSVTSGEVEEMRGRLGLGRGPVLLFLGSIDESKRPAFLVEAMAEVWRRHPDTSLVLVGEGAAAEQLRSSDRRVIPAGRMTGRPLAVLAAAADAIVMPGRVGLVATDSFALEVPIVTTSWPFHSPEFMYLVDGDNALITPDDPTEYGSAVARLLDRGDELERLRVGCRASAARYTTENMVELFRQGVLGALEAGTPKGRSRADNNTARATSESILNRANQTTRNLAKAVVTHIPPLRRRLFTSTDYEVGVTPSDSHSGWSALRAVRRQDSAWSGLVERALRGEPRQDVSALWDALDVASTGTSILEVGSGHGYLADLVKHRLPDLSYVGVDISWPMCRLARTRRPGVSLAVGDAVALPFAHGSVDIVLDAATLMHVPDWRAALAEEARVARKHLILHSVTIADTTEAISMRKHAYGAPVFEAVLSRTQLTEALTAVGFRVGQRFESLAYDLHEQIGVATASETWVCERVAE